MTACQKTEEESAILSLFEIPVELVLRDGTLATAFSSIVSKKPNNRAVHCRTVNVIEERFDIAIRAKRVM
jgi:hypothetical protein